MHHVKLLCVQHGCGMQPGLNIPMQMCENADSMAETVVYMQQFGTVAIFCMSTIPVITLLS